MFKTLEKFLQFVSPIHHLGDRKYSVTWPIVIMLPITAAIEFCFYVIYRDPSAVGLLAISVYLFLIIYSSFRWGIRGGVSSVLFTLCYYVYIIITRGYTEENLQSSVNTSVILGMIYMLLAFLIGWFKQTLDNLIENQALEKRRLQTIIRQLPVGVVVTDQNGVIVKTNNMAREIFGSKFRHGVKINKSVEQLRHAQTGRLVVDEEYPINKALSQKRVIKNKEFMVRKGSGNPQYVLVSSSPVFNKKDEVTAGVSIFQDISLIREIQKRKDDFVNMASHELKTPITSMILFTDILKRRLARKDFKKATETIWDIQKQTQSLKELINTLLDVSRIQTGKIVFKKEKFRLDLLVEEAVRSLSKNGGQKLVISKNPKIEVYADRLRIYQVVLNLISNAVKYSKGKSEIIISVKRKIGGVEVAVRDFGIGIKKGEQTRIFDKLYQVAEDKGATFPGFGMGLYISREIIKRHRGRIWVKSEYGKGSTFYFTLPKK